MIRGYAIGMGAGTQVLTHLPWFIFVGKPGEGTRALLMGAGWVIKVVVAEWIIRRRALARTAPRASAGQPGGVVTGEPLAIGLGTQASIRATRRG
jgi:hypothetical protein